MLRSSHDDCFLVACVADFFCVEIWTKLKIVWKVYLLSYVMWTHVGCNGPVHSCNLHLKACVLLINCWITYVCLTLIRVWVAKNSRELVSTKDRIMSDVWKGTYSLHTRIEAWGVFFKDKGRAGSDSVRCTLGLYLHLLWHHTQKVQGKIKKV